AIGLVGCANARHMSDRLWQCAVGAFLLLGGVIAAVPRNLTAILAGALFWSTFAVYAIRTLVPLARER
ncbi:MAG: hypothetical protein AAF961_13510, partial [Planctomycetota bacterium]